MILAKALGLILGRKQVLGKCHDDQRPLPRHAGTLPRLHPSGLHSAHSVPGRAPAAGQGKAVSQLEGSLGITLLNLLPLKTRNLSHGALPKMVEQTRSSCLPGLQAPPSAPVCSDPKTRELPSTHSWTMVVAPQASASLNQ